MSKEIIAKKAAIVEEVVEKFEKASSVVVVDYRGLTVEEVTNLRKELREAGVEMRVIKNTYLKRAADKAGYEGLDDTFSGPTAVAFADEDLENVMKLLTFIEPEEIEEMTKYKDERINEAKRKAAFEITKLVHGEEEARKAEEATKAAFEGQGNIDAMDSTKIEENTSIVDAIVLTGIT
uniref:50S ribosomal protein L10 n=1 Tax=uncultured Lactobacillus sp. TaxID=153152 RepID=UPI00272D1511